MLNFFFGTYDSHTLVCSDDAYDIALEVRAMMDWADCRIQTGAVTIEGDDGTAVELNDTTLVLASNNSGGIFRKPYLKLTTISLN